MKHGDRIIPRSILDDVFGVTSSDKKGVAGTKSGVIPTSVLDNALSLNPLQFERRRPGFDVNKFSPFIENIDIRRNDLEILRATNQSTGQQLWRATRTMPFNIMFGLLENVGQFFDLESWNALIQNDPADFSNWLTEFAIGGKEWVNNGSEIFRTNPEKVFDWFDPAWYITHASSLIESIVSFYAVGAGSFAAFGKAAAGIAKAINAGANVSRGLGATAALASAATLAYTEGAIEAALVYKQRLEIGINERGMSLEEAQLWAGQGAVKTARTNMLNTLVNITAIAPFMRGLGSVRTLARSPFAIRSGEGIPSYLKRMASQNGKGSAISKLARQNLREAPQEAIEEMWNEVASAEGLVVGTNDPRSFRERLGDTLAQPETRLAALLGAIGGIGQTNIVAFARVPRKVRQEDGTIETVFQSNFSRDQAAIAAFNSDTRNDIVTRLEQYQKDMRDIKEAAESTDAGADAKYARAQNSLFGLAAKDTIKRGIEEQLIRGYEEIRDLKEDEAIALGFQATDKKAPNYYKTLAQDKIDDIVELTNKWNSAEERYGFANDERLAGLPEFVFNLEYAVLANQRTLERTNVQQQKSSELFVKQLIDRKVDPTLADIASRWASIHDVNFETVEDILAEVTEDLKTEAGRQRVNNLFGTDVISDIKTILEAQENDRFNRVGEEIQAINDDMEAYAIANDLGTIENIQKELIQLRRKHSDIFEPIEKLGQFSSDFTRRFISASQSLSNISSGKGRRDYGDIFQREVSRLIEENADDVVASLAEAETAEEFEAVKDKIAEEEAGIPRVKQAIAKKEADLKADEIRAAALRVGKPLTKEEKEKAVLLVKPEASEEEKILTKEEFEKTIPNVGTQAETDRAAQEAREGEALVEQPFVIVNPSMKPEKRAEVLEVILEQTDPETAFDIYDWHRLNFLVDKAFIEASEAHIAALKRAKAGLPPVDQIQLVDAADQANAPLSEEARNTFSSEEALSREISELGTDGDGRQTDSGGTLLLTGFKNVPAASALAGKARETKTIDIELPNGETITRVFTASNERLEGQVPEFESLRYLRKGSAVRVVVDTSNVDELVAEHGDNAYKFIEIWIEQITG